MPKLETPDDAAPQPPTSRKIPLPRNPRTPEEINAFFPPPSDAAPPQPPPPPPPPPPPAMTTTPGSGPRGQPLERTQQTGRRQTAPATVRSTGCATVRVSLAEACCGAGGGSSRVQLVDASCGAAAAAAGVARAGVPKLLPSPPPLGQLPRPPPPLTPPPPPPPPPPAWQVAWDEAAENGRWLIQHIEWQVPCRIQHIEWRPPPPSLTLRAAPQRVASMRSGFSGWCDAAARSTRAWLLLRQVRRIIEARAWRSWRTHVDKRTCNSVLLLRALAHIGARAISRAWRSWEVGLAAAHRVKRITCDAMLRRHQRELHWGFSLVRSHACQRTLRRAAFRRLRRAHDVHARAHSDVTVMARCAVAEWVARSLDAAWRGWRRWCEMAEGARAVSHAGLARRWAAWKATAEASKRRTGLLLRSLRSLCNVELRRGLCSWVQRAAELTLLRRGVAHLRCRELSRGWATWAAAAVERLAALALLAPAVGQFRHTAAARALRSWRAYALESERLRTLAARAVDPCARAWRHWIDHAIQGSRMRAAVYRARSCNLTRALNTWRHDLREIKRLRKVTGYIRSRGLGVWLAATDDRRRWVALVGRALAHLVHCGRARAWNALVAAAVERTRLLGLMQHLAHRVARRGAALAIVRWREALAELVDLGHARALVDAVLGTRLRAAVRAAWRVLARGRRRRCTLRGAFARFHSGYSRAAEDRGHRHRLLTQAVVLWLANSFARSWRSWRGRWSEAARARREYRRCVLRWASQHLSRGWMAWATATTERRRGRERVRVAILALTCLAQRRALNSWEAAHKADMRRRAALRIVDPRLRRMGAGFTRWFERAVQLGPIRRCLSRWRAQGHLRAWATWASTTEERHATLATLARALGHFRNRELSRGWATWAAAAVERQAAFALLAPAVGGQFCLARAFRSWRDAAGRLQVAAARLHRWVHHRLACGWRTWAASAAARREALALLCAAVGHLRSRQRGRAWRTWVVLQAARERLRLIATHLTVARAYRTWRLLLGPSYTMRLAAGRALHRAVARGFLEWLEWVAGAYRTLALASRSAGISPTAPRPPPSGDGGGRGRESGDGARGRRSKLSNGRRHGRVLRSDNGHRMVLTAPPPPPLASEDSNAPPHSRILASLVSSLAHDFAARSSVGRPTAHHTIHYI